MVFAKKADDHLASLVKSLDKLVAEHQAKQFRVVVHLIGDDRDALEKAAKKFSDDCKLSQVPMTVPNEFENGPANWGINPQADWTIFMYKKKRVEFNHAYAGGDVDAAAVKAILADVPKLLQ
jgi:hypothetical protein